MSNKGKRFNHLTIQQRIQMVDWLRKHPAEVNNMTGEEIVKAVTKVIGHDCSIAQIRGTAKAANIQWRIKNTPANRQTRMDKMEKRIIELERWCIATADGLGVQPPETLFSLPDDDEL